MSTTPALFYLLLTSLITVGKGLSQYLLEESLRCEGAVRQCSGEMSALLKCFLYMVVAEIWAEIRYSCGGWCSAAWLIFHSTFFPLLAFLWFLFREDTKQAPCCCLQVGCSAKLQTAGRAYKQ